MSGNKKQPLVSILMNCYNGEKYLREAIESVYSQTYHNWEIIFWDNQSTDQSAAIANSFDNKLKYYKGKQNIPLYAARNKALEKCTGSIIAFLDCDDLWQPTKLEKQIPLFDEPDVRLVYSDAILFSDSGWEKSAFSNMQPQSGNCINAMLKNYFLILPSVMVRSDVADRFRFNENFDISGDAELFLRIAAVSKIAYVNEPLAKWRKHEGNLSMIKSYQGVTELRSLYEHLRQQEVFNQYTKEIDFAYNNTFFDEAKLLMNKNMSSQCRRLLRGHFNLTWRFIILYILSFSPSIYRYVHKVYVA